MAIMSAFARRPVLLAGTAVTSTGGGSLYYYLHHTESGRGVRRQAHFWRHITPVIIDYYWHTGSKSPYVKYWRTSTMDEELELLHKRNSTKVFDVMLQLKGLYVKLGQVLSVTVLPIPEPYRVLFRTLQNNVPGHEPFDIVRGVVEDELGVPLESVFSEFSETPLGAASIGQAHLAKVGDQEVVVKVQYPDAAWQVPADIQCVRGLMRICVAAGVFRKDAANMSFQEFSQQFISEIDYKLEALNLEETYRSSLHSDSPYLRHQVVVPMPFAELCTPKLITMSYLPGPTLESEARRQLSSLGISVTSFRESMAARKDGEEDNHPVTREPSITRSWAASLARWAGNAIGVDSILWLARVLKQLLSSSSGAVAYSVKTASEVIPMPSGVQQWAESTSTSYQQSQKLALTESWMKSLFAVHGYQIFELGLFNADAHPGNILIVEQPDMEPKLGLIDFGQCKRLSVQEQADIGRLILAVAENHSDDEIAAAFRNLGIQTEADSASHLAKLAKLMFGPLKPYHLDHEWHRALHEESRVTYFPTSLSLVYRTTLLLRGLALSLQINSSVAEEWKEQAEKAVKNGAKAPIGPPGTNNADSTGSPRLRLEPATGQSSSQGTMI